MKADVDKRKDTKQRCYRRRYDDGGIAPSVEISSRAQEALRRRAITYGSLPPAAAKEPEKSQAKPAMDEAGLLGVLEELADEWLGK